MPRKDPMTGCMVMTMPEFLAEEARLEGKGRTGGDVLGDIMSEMARADEESSKQLMEDSGRLWADICEFCNLSSVDQVKDWEAHIDTMEEYEFDTKDKFRQAWKNLAPNLRRHFRTKKAYVMHRKDFHERVGSKTYTGQKTWPHPAEMIKVLSARVESGFRSGGTQAEALVLCTDGKKRVITLAYWSSSGSMWEPPDADWDFEWREPTPKELA